MKARIYKFPGNPKPVSVPADHQPASVIILPIVRIERSPSDFTCLDLKPRRKRKFPKVIIPINGERAKL